MSAETDNIDTLANAPAHQPRRMGDLALLRRVWKEARECLLPILAVFLLSLVAAPLSLLAPLPVKLAIDCVLNAHELPAFLRGAIPAWIANSNELLLFLAASLLVVIAIIQYLRGLTEAALATYAAESLILRFRAQLLQHVERLSFRFHDAKGTSESLYRIQLDAMMFEGILLQGLIPISTAVFTLLAMIFVTAQIDSALTMIALATCPILYFLTTMFRKRLRAKWNAAKELEGSAMSVVQEILSSLRVVKAFGRETWEVQRFTQAGYRGLRAKLSAVISECCFSLLIGTTVAVSTSMVLYVGVKHVQAGTLTLGDLVLVMLYLAMLYQPLETIGVKYASLQSALASADRAFALLDTVPDVAEQPQAIPLTITKGAITFCQVGFAYDQDAAVLSDLSFDIPPGSRVGIAGTTGAGKTTLINLLPRFHDPTSGRILLDGTDLREYRLADLRRQFAIVLQETVLFSTSIAENIAYSRPDASEAEIIAAAKAAHAHEFITRLPRGYETQVGERGMRLSGGERQRIGLARAFLRNAPILILDEPTSSVDVKTENLVLDALEQLMQGRTTFLISHRPNTLDNCDLRLRLEQGRLVSCDRPSLALDV